MKKINFLGAAAALVIGTTAVHAASVDFDTNPGGLGLSHGVVITGDAPANVIQNLSSDSASIEFQWGPTDPNYLAYSEFTLSAEWTLTFNDYSPEKDRLGEEGSKSGFQLYAGSFGSLTPLFEIGGADCGSDVGTSFGSQDCVLVTGASNDSTSFLTPVEDYSGLAAGTYVLMFSEGSNPTEGSAEFLITPVPLPAGAFLLLGGLGGLAAMRRRKKVA